MRPPLPIDALLPAVVDAVASRGSLVLRAAPGAGKTTRVPAALLDAGLARGRQILVLEPRRLAARAAAAFVARERATALGTEVGYRVRYDSCGRADTKLWFLTEGILGRQLVHDPFLEQVGIVVLDEFHERHLAGDVALAIVRELRQTVRPDLHLVVMSATLETDRLSAYLGDSPVLTSEGRQYPVTVEYRGDGAGPLVRRVVAAVEQVLLTGTATGDVLVFLPGAAEIRRSAAELQGLAGRLGVDLVALHGDLPLEEQQRAIQPGRRRKVVLSTNVAETSLTIEGVTTVVDCGLARQARFDAGRGINTLSVMPISRAAAIQRAGRAGRQAPGHCLRLGTEADFQQRRAFETPEVQRLDLSAVVLELRAWGTRDMEAFPWLDAPTAGMLGRADGLLRQLGALDAQGGLSAIGRQMLALPLEPRLARSLVEAQRRGCVADAALLIALASERDICVEQRGLGTSPSSHWGSGDSDLLLRAELFCKVAAARFGSDACRMAGVEPRTVRAVERARQQLLRLARTAAAPPALPESATALICLLAGYPDRVCRRRDAGSRRALMVGGTGVELAESSVVRDAELFIAVDVEGGRAQAEARVRLASAVRREWLEQVYPEALRRCSELWFDPQGERVVEVTALRFHDLDLERRTRTDVDRLAAGAVLAAAARQSPEQALHVDDGAEQLLGRLEFLQRAMPELDFPADRLALLSLVAESVAQGQRSFAEMRRADVGAVLRRELTPPQRRALDEEAPSEYRLPTGRAVRVVYAAGKPPAIAARVQELFGQRRTPRLAAGRVAMVVELLAPNGRPVQITDDLESFWTRTYPEVRKVMRGRYPKHPWPEDPFSMAPTARTKRRAMENQ